MNYANIKYNDIANGEGIRTSLFVSGCRNNCPGCFNKEAQDFNCGEEFTDEIMDKIINSVDDKYHDGITLLGGDPMEPENAEVLCRLAEKFKKKYGDTKTIWCYTGYIYESINALDTSDYRHKLLSFIDILVDGPFIEAEKDITLRFKGSRNQRIIKLNSITDNKSKSVCANIIG